MKQQIFCIALLFLQHHLASSTCYVEETATIPHYAMSGSNEASLAACTSCTAVVYTPEKANSCVLQSDQTLQPPLKCVAPYPRHYRTETGCSLCHDFMMDFVAPNSNPALLSMTETGIYQCDYYADELDFQNEPVPACEDVTCPKDSQLIAYNPDLKKVSFLVTARYDGGGWFGTPAGGKEIYLGWPYDTVLQRNSMQFGCTIRCGGFVGSDGVEYPSKCNAKDAAAVCNEDRSLPLCTCSPGYTGTTCGATIEMYERIDTWLGPEEAKKLLDLLTIAKTSPAALVSLMPSIYAMLPQDKKIAMGWSIDEMIDSLDYELREINYTAAFTQVFDEQLGNCYTFNYANKTNEGRYSTRFAGQNRDFNIILKLDPSEQAAWVDSASISTFIHAPGTPPDHGALYSVRGGASDLVALRKGCYAACYQDKVLEKCGCMDARMKKAATARQCDFKDNDCIVAVSVEYEGATTWSNCVCPPECYKEAYTISATRGALPFKLPDCGNATLCPDPTQSTARLTIYMDSLESEVYVEEEKITFITLLSNLGGQLGFVLGISVVGVIEVIVLCGQLGKEAFTSKNN
ncbi:hypothetical protein PRIPAC_80252 [Pristionchus pacificus]|uniref:Ion channel n=2 Tax=Pristionchus pacificus TaxID=54126 RepID=A0A2A6CLS4_PRIPA|nr:hypothetical protein PRIPAC_80252 [Pristionchus pacificus]|eukprot:PDM79066.1 ion channel [Pristionchus pacificus]